MAKYKEVYSSAPARTPKLQFTAEQPSTKECWIPPKKDTSCPRAKEEPQQDSRRGKIMFRIKPHSHQKHSEGSNKFCVHQDPETSQRLSQTCLWVFECLLQRYRSPVACHRGVAALCSRPVSHSMGHESYWEITINPTIESPSRQSTNWRRIIPNKFSCC